MNVPRLAGLAALALGLLSCEKSIFEEPRARATSVSISYDLSPAALVVAGGPAAAFDATNALSMVLSRDEAVVFDTLMSFVPAEETRVSLEIPDQTGDENFRLELTLLSGEQAIFRGTGTVSLTRGGVTPVDLTLDPVPSAVDLDRSVNTLGIGDTIQLSGMPLFATGHGIPDVALAWSADDSEHLELDATTGRIVGRAEGTTRVTGSFAGLGDTLSVTVRSVVESVSVSLGSLKVGLGESTPATATVLDRRGNLLLRAVGWSTSDPKIATVDASGVVTVVGEGSVTVTATAEGKSGSATLFARSSVDSVTVALAAANVGLGQTTTATAVARDARGNVLDRTVEWSSSDGRIATVSAAGVVTAVSEGSVTVTATAEGRSGSASLVVRSAVETVAVTLASARIGLGETAQAAAEVRDGNGNVLVRTVEWSSSNPAIATVDAAGLVKAVNEGTVTIAAVAEGKRDTASLVVRSVASAVTVTLPAAELSLGQSVQATAVVFDARGYVLVRTVSWSTSDGKIAAVSPTGLVTGAAEGTATITATAEGKSGSASVVVRAAVATVTVTLPAEQVGLGESVQASAVVRDAAGNPLVRTVNWRTSDARIATVNATGLVTGVSEGTATITGEVEGRSGEASLRVRSTVSTVTVTLSQSEIDVRETAQASAVARDARGNVLARPVSWTTSDERIAIVNAAGLVTGVGDGTATITGLVEGISGSASIRVRSCVAAPPPLLRNAFPLSASVARNSGVLVDVVLNPILVDGRPVTGLEESNFMVAEDGCSRPFTVTTSEGAVGVDLVFIQDLSGSMGGAITGVRTSVISFAQQLAERGLDIRIGSVGYSGPSTIPSTPAGSPSEYLGPVQDLAGPAEFQAHVTREWYASGGGDAPENGLEAIEYAHHNLSWRPGATRVMIMITDISQHWSGSGCSCSDQSLETIVKLIGSSTVVHVVAPLDDYLRTYPPGMDPWLLAEATGGAQLELGSGVLDLNALQIETVLAETIRLTFESASADPVTHDLRVRVTLPTGLASEFVADGIRYDPLDVELRMQRILSR